APEVPIEAVESVALEEPLEGRIPAPVKTAQLAKTPKSAAKQPLVKNEIHTMGRWQDKPLEWLVLDVQPDRALLIARDCLLQAPYNEEQKTVTWKQCTLRKNLLPQLLTQIFDATEQNNVLSSNNRNPDNENYGTPGGADTEDKLFLLSIDEVKKYFPYDEARVAHLNGKAVFWWLRSPGLSSYLAAFVSTGGLVSGNGYLVSWSEGSVRPAFWLNRQS
ncbi:MAG: DUF6273 domain-containing protein, partial [Firmicutes bacterium]|nr:DUF6273 domain-containing protein [Bacillota bacterium]